LSLSFPLGVYVGGGFLDIDVSYIVQGLKADNDAGHSDDPVTRRGLSDRSLDRNVHA